MPGWEAYLSYVSAWWYCTKACWQLTTEVDSLWKHNPYGIGHHAEPSPVHLQWWHDFVHINVWFWARCLPARLLGVHCYLSVERLSPVIDGYGLYFHRPSLSSLCPSSDSSAGLGLPGPAATPHLTGLPVKGHQWEDVAGVPRLQGQKGVRIIRYCEDSND